MKNLCGLGYHRLEPDLRPATSSGEKVYKAGEEGHRVLLATMLHTAVSDMKKIRNKWNDQEKQSGIIEGFYEPDNQAITDLIEFLESDYPEKILLSLGHIDRAAKWPQLAEELLHGYRDRL